MAIRKALPGTPEPMHTWEGSAGNRLSGDSWGDPAAKPAILMHGGGQTRHSWRRTAQYLADAGYYAVAYDARGHGDSDWAEDGDYTEPAFAADLACVVRAIGGDRPDAPRPVLIGASLGGVTSMVAAGRGVVAPAAVILADVAHVTASDGFERVNGFMSRYSDGFASLDEAAQAVAEYRGQPYRGNPQGLAKNLRQDANGRLYWHWDPRFIVGRREAMAARNVFLRECVREITAPTLLVRGGRSDVVTPEAVREFLELCPQASHVDVAGAGHMLTGDDNDAFGEVAIEFIRKAA